MTRSDEARLWHTVGALVFITGGLMLAYAFAQYGPASVEPRAVRVGLTASFLMLAGAVAFIAGRTLHVEETGLTSLESSLWIILAVVSLIAGGVVVAAANFMQGLLVFDRLAMGLAGAFALMTGVVCLVGQRVMSHMHDLTK